MTRFVYPICVLFACGALLTAQSLSQEEQQSLQRSLGEAGNSPTEFVRAIENHLKQFPNSPKRAELERALVKTAMDLNDDRRLIEFGPSVLTRDPENMQVLEHLATALLHQGDKLSAQRALDYARELADLIQTTYQNDKFEPGGGPESQLAIAVQPQRLVAAEGERDQFAMPHRLLMQDHAVRKPITWPWVDRRGP